MRAAVVIPTFNARELLADALASLERQTLRPQVVVVDNASSDGTADLVRRAHPAVRLVRLPRNVGFGRAVNAGAAVVGEADALVLVNNDTVCEPDFVERLVAPLANPRVGMVAGVLVQASDPRRVDSAGIELDSTLRSWDIWWNRPVATIADAPPPVGPCGGAAAYRLEAFGAVGGFDEAFFAYWEDVDLALRLRLAGWSCVRVDEARALHAHAATLGSASPAQRRLEAFGRGFVLERYGVVRGGLRARLAVAALDWPVLAVHLLARREAGPIRARARGRLAAAAGARHPAPLELARVPFAEALRRQAGILQLRLSGRLPEHFYEPEGGRRQSRLT